MSQDAGIIRSLGYLGIGAPSIDEWEPFARDVLGLQPYRQDGHLYLRYDDNAWRIRVQEPDVPGHLAFLGWEVADERDLRALAQRLADAGVDVDDDQARAAERKVKAVVRCTDPNGVANEFYCGAYVPQLPFVSPVGARFVTGDMGLGHLVLLTTDIAQTNAFYLDLLGFQVSDYIELSWGEATFTHVNPRHHTLAYAQAPVNGIQHFMLEVTDLPTVGYALDRVHRHQVPLAMSMGQHTNDHMVSFYMRNPSGFDIEYGTGGRHIDDTWSIASYDAPSLWGHARPGAGTR